MKPLARHHAEVLSFATEGRGTVDITRAVGELVASCSAGDGLCYLFILHTSASLMVCENADPSVRGDLDRFFARLVPDGDPMFRHTDEGPDDMSAHVRSVLTQTSVTLPIARGQLALGTWQGVYLWEHRTHPHTRRVMVSVVST